MELFHVEKSSVEPQLKCIDLAHNRFFQCLCFCNIQKGAKNRGLENCLDDDDDELLLWYG